MRRWLLYMHLTKSEISFVHISMKFYNIPLELWTNDVLSLVTNVIGKPLYLDEYAVVHSRLIFTKLHWFFFFFQFVFILVNLIVVYVLMQACRPVMTTASMLKHNFWIYVSLWSMLKHDFWIWICYFVDNGDWILIEWETELMLHLLFEWQLLFYMLVLL